MKSSGQEIADLNQLAEGNIDLIVLFDQLKVDLRDQSPVDLATALLALACPDGTAEPLIGDELFEHLKLRFPPKNSSEQLNIDKIKTELQFKISAN